MFMGVRYAYLVAATIIITLLLSNHGLAQSPQRTTASYDDWTLRCETREGTPAQKSCEIVQIVQMQGQAVPLAQIAIGRAAMGDPLKIVFQVPISVWLPDGVRLVYDSKEPPLAGIFKRCVPAACFSDIDLKDDIVKKLRSRTEQGRLEFKDGAQRDVAIPVSFKGFGQAFDAMSKE